MTKIKSRLDSNSREFKANAEHMRKRIADLDNRLEKARLGGPSKIRDKHLQRGKLLVRERVKLLLDDDAPFLELSPLAASAVYEDDVPSAGIVTGIGQVHGHTVVVIANDATVKGGTYYPLTVKKHLRAQEIAEQNHLPCIYLVDSGGAFLPMQDEVFPDHDHFGRIFYNQARLSAQGCAQIAIVMGSCTAGGAYVPAMSDEAIIIKQQGTIFLGGPPLVRAATGEEVDAESLGGGDVHTRISGVADHLADNDAQALEMARQIVSNLNLHQPAVNDRRQPYDEPDYLTEEIFGVIPRDPRLQYDVHEVITRLVDASEFDEFKALYGQTLVCGFARIEGNLVGILANNGILFSESAMKGTHFIQLCNQRGVPMVFLQNIAGFMVGKKYEHEGIAKHGAKMVSAVACSEVPKFTIIIGGSYGAGNYAMCGRAYAPHFLWMWPNARISVMGADTAADLLTTVKRQSTLSKMTKANNKDNFDEEAQAAFKKEIHAQFERQGDPYYATARLWDDGIINPVTTRTMLGMAISASRHAPVRETRYGVFRM